MNNIYFDEVHADDIMSEDDPRYLWGYREDVFYKKALEIDDSSSLFLANLGNIYHRLGEYENAISLADQMLSIPSRLTVNSLKLSPIYDPFRENPRFQELIAKYSD